MDAHWLSHMDQIKNIATIVVTNKPMHTGSKFRRASSNGLTLQMAAAGMSAHGIKVPPPTQIAVIWPRAVNVAVPLPIAVPNSFATEPAGKYLKTRNHPSR